MFTQGPFFALFRLSDNCAMSCVSRSCFSLAALSVHSRQAYLASLFSLTMKVFLALRFVLNTTILEISGFIVYLFCRASACLVHFQRAAKHCIVTGNLGNLVLLYDFFTASTSQFAPVKREEPLKGKRFLANPMVGASETKRVGVINFGLLRSYSQFNSVNPKVFYS